MSNYGNHKFISYVAMATMTFKMAAGSALKLK